MRNFFSASTLSIVVAASATATIIGVMACSTSTTGPPTTDTQLTVHSTSVTTAPAIDGVEDGAWSGAQWTTVHMKPVNVVGNTLSAEYDLQIKSVHDATSVYFLVKFPDATADESPNTLVFNGGDPSLAASWTNSYNGQDGLSFMWDMKIGGLSARDGGGKFSDSAYGCQAACHATSNYSSLESGMFPLHGGVDIWFWNAGTTNPQGYADDQYAVGDDSNGTSSNSRRNYDRASAGYFAFANYSASEPGKPNNIPDGYNGGLDKFKFLWNRTSAGFPSSINHATNAAWAKNDVVPGWALDSIRLLLDAAGEAEVRAKGVHSGGNWIVELQRTLTTKGVENDIQFDPANQYAFSLSTHDNARKFTGQEYLAHSGATQPSHYGCVPRRVMLKIE